MEGEIALGWVRWFDARRGYGFIARDGAADLFVHFAAIAAPGFRQLRPGMAVAFRIVPGPRGEAAGDVRPLPRRFRRTAAWGARRHGGEMSVDQARICPRCAWRVNCAKRFGRGDDATLHCPDFSEDVTLRGAALPSAPSATPDEKQ